MKLNPAGEFPEDSRLPDLPLLFDADWVWSAYTDRYGDAEREPERIRIDRFTHGVGRTATATYIIEWPKDAYLPRQYATARATRNRPTEFYRYPDDPALPGLPRAAEPEGAQALLQKHVLPVPVRRVRVEMIRYRAGSRAVLRHRAGARFYARAMRPAVLDSYMSALDIVSRSGFVVPRLAGQWADGGVLWLSEIPGTNVRELVRQGDAPNPDALLSCLSSLWDVPTGSSKARPFDLPGVYRNARRLLTHAAQDSAATRDSITRATTALNAFIESWQPKTAAHNDFYDDQMLALPDGRVATVDFEEAGPGDPMLDVGNFLAHLRWAVAFGGSSRSKRVDSYYAAFRSAALDRLDWSEHDLALREATCLFRICTNVIRIPRTGWRGRLDAGLNLVHQTLG